MVLRIVKQLDAGGVRIVAGTDSQFPGFALHRELELYVEAGIPAPRVLQIATIDAARVMAVDQQLGSITPGKLASLGLVDGDPSADIAALRRTRLVLHRGAILFPGELHAALSVTPFAPAPALTAP